MRGRASHADMERLAKEHRRQLLVDGLAGAVDHVCAQLLEQQLQQHAQQGPHREHHQCGIALAGHHPVVHLHRIQGAHQTHHTQDQGGDDGVKKHHAVLAHRVQKPVTGGLRHVAQVQLGHGAGLELQHLALRQRTGVHLAHLPLRVFGAAVAVAELPAQQEHTRTIGGHPQQRKLALLEWTRHQRVAHTQREMRGPQLLRPHRPRQRGQVQPGFGFLAHAKTVGGHRMALQRRQTAEQRGQFGVLLVSAAIGTGRCRHGRGAGFALGFIHGSARAWCLATRL